MSFPQPLLGLLGNVAGVETPGEVLHHVITKEFDYLHKESVKV